ncbi:putative RNA methyltransferase [Thermoactinospora rubra]|uniref:putative RNA methyltransferase n=1 Tax=Thermoactinospora rubra TaxID=1088767 RepID=UPI000A10E2C2|nr:methyltransferase domain-containing protein [Thermoactinospora rubra]
MLADIAGHLRCPVCRGPVRLGEGALRCERGHSFDVARQGYVSLLAGSRPPGTADTPAMVAARAAFLAAGHYAPLARALAGAVAGLLRDAPPYPLVVDAGTGTGYYLGAVLDAAPQAIGMAFDISKHAVRRAARAHERAGAFVADVWRPLPVADAVADVILNVFAPRNGPEFRRILRPGGALMVVTPAPGHLSPLVEELGLLSVDPDKDRRLAAGLEGFTLESRREVGFDLLLTREDALLVTGMGPSAWHADMSQLKERLAQYPDQLKTRANFYLSSFKAGS